MLKLFTKGPKYRIPSKINFEQCRDVIYEALDSLIKCWCKRENVKPYALDLWKSEIIKIINARVENFNIHPDLYQQPKTISKDTLKSKLARIHEEFVIAPADKASNNVIFI